MAVSPPAPSAEADDPVVRGTRIRAARLAGGLSQKELAHRIGATQSLIGQIENGLVERSKYETLIMFELGVPLDPETERWIVVSRQRKAADAAMDARVEPGHDDPEAHVPPLPAIASAPVAPEPPAEWPEIARRQRLAADYELFAAERLCIRSKRGAIEPLVFNRAQRHIHAELEAQKAATGKVRALILKGRQQGCSTYVGGRFYHRVTHARGLKVFILSHEDQASRNLFEMVERFHEHDVDRPSTGVANASELWFDELDSGYKVGTAGTRGVGRSSTVQLLHGSEVAFWPHAQTHAAGLLQAVPDEPGTEVILESTAHGVGNLFHKMWRDAETALNGYVPIFVPWYWQEEYRRAVDPDFTLTTDEHDYAARYRLGSEQMMWRRMKIAELGDTNLFEQEYPATAAEAFRMTGHDSFIPPELIARARRARCDGAGPLVIGYDPAWLGGDRHAMAWRRGRRVVRVEARRGLDTVAAAAWVQWVIDDERPAKLFIDVGGVGAGVYDQLKSLGSPYSEIVVGVNFGGTPVGPMPLDELGRPFGGPLNRRAEMYGRLKQWLEDPAGVQIPDCDALQADVCGPGYRYDALTRLILESKDDMRRRGALSPDLADAVVLTFAQPVTLKQSRFHRKIEYPPTGWM